MKRITIGILALICSASIYADGSMFRTKVTAAEGGTIARVRLSNNSFQLTAIPADGYRFDQWEDGSTDNPRTIDVSSAKPGDEYNALFKADGCGNFHVTRTECEHGEVIVSLVDACNCEWSLRAVPIDGYAFSHWSDGTLENPRIVQFNELGTAKTATFVQEIGWYGEGHGEGVAIEDWQDVNMVYPYARFTSTSDCVMADSVMVFVDEDLVNVTDVFVEPGENDNYYSGHGTWLIPANIAGQEGHDVRMIFINKGSQTVQAFYDFTAPIIVPNGQLRDLASLPALDTYSVYVLNGGTANIQDANNVIIDNLYIAGGGQVTVGGDQTLIVTTNIIMAMDGLNQLTPRLNISSGGSVVNENSNVIYLDYIAQRKTWYPIAIPYQLRHASTDSYINIRPTGLASFQMRDFSGSRLVDPGTGTGWADFNDRTSPITENVGYIFFAVPPRNNIDRRSQSVILRFPMYSSPSFAPASVATIATEASGDEETEKGKKNWNFVPTPFLTEYDGDILMCNENESAKKALRYITYTDDDFKSYKNEEVGEKPLQPFCPYFMQLEDGYTHHVKFGAVAPASAPARRQAQASVANWELKSGIVLSQGAYSDRTGVLVGPAFTTAYDFNADLGKMVGDDPHLMLYSLLGSQRLAYNAQPAGQLSDLNETVIPLGYTGAVAGQPLIFTFDDERYSADNIEALYLTDKTKGKTVNLLDEPYVCTDFNESDDTRFELGISYRAQGQGGDATGCEELRSTALPDGIYDLLGRPIRSNANVLPAGVYIVVREGKAEKEVIR